MNKLPLLPGGHRLKLATADSVLGGNVWPSASALCQFLLHHHQHYHRPQLETKKNWDCVELGSGTGAVGLFAAAALGCRVTLTEHCPPMTSVLTSIPYAPDGTPEWIFPDNNTRDDSNFLQRKSRRLLDLIELNVQQNSHLFSQPPRVLELDWTDPQQAQQVQGASQSGDGYNLVLASDVTYFTQLHPSLADTIATILRKDQNNSNDDKETVMTTPKCFVSHQVRLLNWRGVDSHLTSFEKALTNAGLAIVERHEDGSKPNNTNMLVDSENLPQNPSQFDTDKHDHNVCILEIQHV